MHRRSHAYLIAISKYRVGGGVGGLGVNPRTGRAEYPVAKLTGSRGVGAKEGQGAQTTLHDLYGGVQVTPHVRPNTFQRQEET